MTLTDADLDHLASLARLELADGDREGLRRDLDRLLGYVALLQEVDVAGVAPMARGAPLVDVLRDDVVTPAPPSIRDALPEADADGRIRVPRTVDQDA